MTSSNMKTKTTTITNYFEVTSNDQQERMRQSFARAMYSSNVAFNIVTNEHWKQFFKELKPSFQMPTRKVLAGRLLDAEYQKVISMSGPL